MSNMYCNKLYFSVAPLIPEVDITKFKDPQTKLSVSFINPEIKKLLNDVGIVVNYIELFCRPAGNISSIHCDEQGGDFTKINWIYGGRGSDMAWYTVKETTAPRHGSKTGVNTDYIAYQRNEVDIVHYEHLQGPYLVQVGAPHLVINPVETRFCLCFVITDKNGNRITMENSQALLRKFMV